MSDRTFLDTNVLVYLFDGGNPAKQARVQQILFAEDAKETLYVSTQVMQEMYSVVTRKFAKTVSAEDAEKALRKLATMNVVVLVPDLILAAAARSRKDTINFWDALIVEAALAAGCTRIFTEDFQPERHFGTLRIANPFPGYV